MLSVLVTHRARDPPLSTDPGCISIKALAAQIQLFCALFAESGEAIAVTPGRAEENRDVELADVPVRDVRPLLAEERADFLALQLPSGWRRGWRGAS